MKKFFYATLLFVIFASSCGNKTKAQSEQQTAKPQEQKATSKKQFTLPSVPQVITDAEGINKYIASHYWDNFDFTDTASFKPDYAEQIFADYLYLLNNVDRQTLEESTNYFITKTEVDSVSFAYFTGLYEHYLDEPNSPYRSSEMYIPVLQRIIASKMLSDDLKVRPKYRLDMDLKNRIGARATDFDYTLANGKSGRMYNINSPYLVLFFNNPGCPACREGIDFINKSALLQQKIADKTLTVLAVYSETDLDEWQKYLPQMPQNWIVSYNKSHCLQNDDLYDLRATPTVYLLDKDKNVIIKDIFPVNILEQFFASH